MVTRRVLRIVLAALTVTIVGALPVFLLGGLAVQIRADLGLSETQLGLSVTAFFAVSAGGSAWAGRVVERLGMSQAMKMTAGLVALGLLGMSLATSWAWLLVVLAVAAVGNAFSQPAANLLLARGVRRARQGTVFGLKQSAVPFTSLLGGAAVPIFALTVGWRWAFVAAIAFAGLLWALVPSGAPPAGTSGRARGSSTRVQGRMLPLVVLTGAGMLGNMGANSLGIFLVETAVRRDLTEATAGLLLVLGSSLGITGRVVCGWWADRALTAYIPVMAGMLLAGAIGYAGLAAGAHPAVFVAGTVLAFGCGWGWNGLFTYSVVEAYRRTPAAATGIAQTGLFIGAMTGPGLFGVTAQYLGFTVAWGAAGVCALLSAVAMLVAHRLLRQGDEVTLESEG